MLYPAYYDFYYNILIHEARMFGDPHLVTLDGYQYTFNGKGEFVLVEASDQSFILQGRMTEPVTSANTMSGGTSIMALAMKLYGNPTIQLEVINNTLAVLVDGDVLDFAGQSEQRIDNVTIVDKGNDTIAVRMTPGISIQASKTNGILTNIVITVPESFNTKGLLGQYNGNSTDDLLSKNGTLLLTNSTGEQIFHEFGLSCKSKFTDFAPLIATLLGVNSCIILAFSIA